MSKKITKLFCIIMAIVSLLGSTSIITSAASRPQPRYGDPMYVTAAGGLNVRKAAGLSGKVIATLPYGTKVNVSSFAGVIKDGYTWFKIDSPKKGYVAYNYLSYTRPRSIIIDTNEPSVG